MVFRLAQHDLARAAHVGDARADHQRFEFVFNHSGQRYGRLSLDGDVSIFGRFDVEIGVPARIEDMAFRAEAFAETIEAPQLAIRDLGLSAELSGGALDVRGDGKILDWAVALSTRLHPFDLSVPAGIVVNARGDQRGQLEGHKVDAVGERIGKTGDNGGSEER